MLKIKGTEIQQRLKELALEAVGRLGAPCPARRWQVGAEPVGRDCGRGRRGHVLQHPQDLDLRRLERDPAQHHRQDGARALTPPHTAGRSPVDFSFTDEQSMLRDTVARLPRATYYVPTSARRWSARSRAGGRRSGRPSPRSWASWARRSRGRWAASAAARSRTWSSWRSSARRWSSSPISARS